MTPRIIIFILGALVVAASASAQFPAFDVDDFVAPGDGVMFVSRVGTGYVANLIDGYRPAEQNALFVHLANSLYWSNFQLDYKRSEVRGSEESGRAHVQSCRCTPPIYFPTPPPRDATPAAPLPGSRDTLQFSFYRRQSGIVLRTRATYERQAIDTTVTSITNGDVVAKLSGDEQTFGLDADLSFGHHLFGSLIVARTIRDGTTDDDAQTTIAYVARIPVVSLRRILLRPTITVAAVSGRGHAGLNVINPAIEAYWHDVNTGVNVHLIWSPQTTRDGVQSWRTKHQLAFFVDSAIFARLFGVLAAPAKD
ncbi:MAG: hypothetical protein QOI24_4687 [Acidobacteriota bacterium]|jgi:hypothetical protein|nr:hypothetical protein [Acidobacteriota bacterium]